MVQAWVAEDLRICNTFRRSCFAVPIAAVGTDAGHGRRLCDNELIGVVVTQKTVPQKSFPSVCDRYRKLAPGSSLELEDEELVSWATARAARRATASFQWVPAVDIIPAQAAVSQSRPSSTRLASHGHAPALRSSVLRALHPAMQQDGEQRHEWQPMRAGPVPCIVWTGQTRGRSRNGRIRRQRHDRAAAAVRQGRQIVRGDGRHGPE